MSLPGVDYWITNLIGFAVAFMLLRMIASRTGDWLTYAHLFSVLWGANLLVSQVALSGLLRPEISTLAILFAAWWMFLGGTLCIIRKKHTVAASEVYTNRFRAVAILLMFMVLQGLAFAFEMRSLQLDPISLFSDFFRTATDLRLRGVYSTIELPFTLSIWRWGQVLYIPLALFLHSKRMISGKFLVMIYVFALVMSAGRYTRAPVDTDGSR